MGRPPKYVPQAKTKEFHVTSRVSAKIGDEFYTFEYCETRCLDNPDTVNMDKETAAAWEYAHLQVDAQVREVLNLNKK